MELEKRIMDDIKAAMRVKDAKKLEALRAVKAAILLAKTEKGTTDEGIGEEREMAILKRLVKQRKDSAQLYHEQGRKDLEDDENYQASVIEVYLPEQMSEEEIRREVLKIIEQTGAESMRDMGKVMGLATRSLAGKADNKLISGIVKEALS